MEQNVVSLSKDCTYRFIQRVLIHMPQLRAFPVVDHPDTKVLLGSISRFNLIRLLDAQLGDKSRRQEAERRLNANVTGNVTAKQKIIISKMKGLRLREMSLNSDAVLSMEPSDSEVTSKNANLFAMPHFSKKYHVDLSDDEKHSWERRRLACRANIPSEMLDSAPFQLVPSTSLYKVYSLFSLLGLRRAYVTNNGVLVGVVGLTEIRNAIELAQSGELQQILKPTEGVEEEQEQEQRTGTASLKTRLSFKRSLSVRNTDSDSEDFEDCILPRVELEEKQRPSLELERRFTRVLFRSSDVGQDLAIAHSQHNLMKDIEMAPLDIQTSQFTTSGDVAPCNSAYSKLFSRRLRKIQSNPTPDDVDVCLNVELLPRERRLNTI